jgi:glycosyltransferase involved in cell wall biosynthesis
VSTVSVVVPTYNRARFLGPTLESILAQTVAPHEVIVVDDESTDDTGGVAARYPVRYLRQANTGQAGARNHGVSVASGEWVAFCDSDDLWRPDLLETQLAALAQTGAGWCVGGCSLIDPDGRPLPAPHLGFPAAFAIFAETGSSPDEHFGRWLERRALRIGAKTLIGYVGDAFGMLFEGNVALPSTTLVRRTLLDQIGGFDASWRAAEDTEFYHRLSAVAPVCIVLDALVDYRVGHPSTINSGDQRPMIVATLESLERARRLRPSLSPAEKAAYRSGRARLQMRLAYARLTALDGSGARIALRAGLRAGAPPSLHAAAIFAASLLPSSALVALHRLKRRLRGLPSPAAA